MGCDIDERALEEGDLVSNSYLVEGIFSHLFLSGMMSSQCLLLL